MYIPGHFFQNQIFKRNINDCYCNFLCLSFPPSKFFQFAFNIYQFEPNYSYHRTMIRTGRTVIAHLLS